MVLNVLNIWGEIILIVVSVVALITFCLIFLPFNTRRKITTPKMEEYPYSVDTPEKQNEKDMTEEETIRADEYIESFNGNVVSGRGIVPVMVIITLIGLLVWWVGYMVLNWSQYLVSVRTFWR